MLALFCVATVFAAASASKCCIPPQWEGQMSSLIGASSAPGEGARAVTTNYIAYDAVSHKIGVMETVTVGDGSEQFAILLDYNSDTRFVINNGVCIKQRLGRSVSDFGGCIPDNATVLGSNDVIGFGSNDANINSYAMYYPGVVAYISVTADACVPVVENVRGKINDNTFIQNNYYFNITAGLSDQTVANLKSPPAECVNAPLVESHYTQSFIGKRSMLGFMGL